MALPMVLLRHMQDPTLARMLQHKFNGQHRNINYLCHHLDHHDIDSRSNDLMCTYMEHWNASTHWLIACTNWQYIEPEKCCSTTPKSKVQLLLNFFHCSQVLTWTSPRSSGGSKLTSGWVLPHWYLCLTKVSDCCIIPSPSMCNISSQTKLCTKVISCTL